MSALSLLVALAAVGCERQDTTNSTSTPVATAQPTSAVPTPAPAPRFVSATDLATLAEKATALKDDVNVLAGKLAPAFAGLTEFINRQYTQECGQKYRFLRAISPQDISPAGKAAVQGFLTDVETTAKAKGSSLQKQMEDFKVQFDPLAKSVASHYERVTVASQRGDVTQEEFDGLTRERLAIAKRKSDLSDQVTLIEMQVKKAPGELLAAVTARAAEIQQILQSERDSARGP